MSHSVFGYPLRTSDAWREESIYTFRLEEPEAAPLSHQLGAGGDRPMHPNVVITREPLGGRGVAELAAARRRSFTEKMPTAQLKREGAIEIGGLSGQQEEFEISLDEPRLRVSQWQVTLEREGFGYHFTFSAPTDKFEGAQPAFRKLIESWA